MAIFDGFTKGQLSLFGFVICGAAVVALGAWLVFKMLQVRRPQPAHPAPSSWLNLNSLVSRRGRQSEQPTPASANQVEQSPQANEPRPVLIRLEMTCPDCGKSMFGILRAAQPPKSKSSFPYFVWAGATIGLGAYMFYKMY